MSLRSSSSLLVVLTAPVLLAVAVTLTQAGAHCPPAWLPLDSQWTIEPDPPTTGADLEVSYDGEETEVFYQVDGEDPVPVDLSELSSFTIPAAKLRGKRYVKLIAHGGEDNYRIVRLP